MDTISGYFKQADIYCDGIPLIRSLSSAVVIFQKCIITLFSIDTSKSHYYSHIHSKSFKDCFIFLIPVAGDIYYYFNKNAKTSSRKIEPSSLEKANDDTEFRLNDFQYIEGWKTHKQDLLAAEGCCPFPKLAVYIQKQHAYGDLNEICRRINIACANGENILTARVILPKLPKLQK